MTENFESMKTGDCFSAYGKNPQFAAIHVDKFLH
jgi:hypothetical protein